MLRALAIWGLLILTGSASAQEGGGEAVAEPPVEAVGADPLRYPIGARDSLAVDIYDENSLSGTFIVDDDGTVDLPLLGRVRVVGLTLAQADDLITQSLARDFLVNPQVTVRIASFGSKPVQVLGSVSKPGTYYLAGPTSLLEILTLAGGIKDPAAVEIRVQRPSQPGQLTVASLETLVATGSGNVALAPGDVVYVPPGPVVYVSGEVGKPGTVAFLEGLSVVEAINKAGGATDRASLRNVYLLRDGQRTRVNTRRILKGRDTDVSLLPDDHVYVEESVF